MAQGEVETCPRKLSANGLLRLRRVPPRPGHVERGLRACGLDRLVEESDIPVHASGVLERQRALLLEHDAVVATLLDRLGRPAAVPVGAKRRTAGADQAVLDRAS